MKSTVRTVGLAVAALLLALPAFALAAQPRGGTFTSTKADIHVTKAAPARIHDAEINCKQSSGGLTLQAINFGTPISIKASGAFTYHGTAAYVSSTGSGYKSRMTTASLKGRFDSRTRVHGTVTGGPRACSLVRFTATYNPRAH